MERDRLAHTIELVRAAVLDHEQAYDEALRRTGDDDAVGLCRALHARSG